ncbi:MvdC/MvdD family ATP grasp protein [Streptosporangium sp. NPDC002544]|uniref:ATP-grasp domain-containing protein n=1 Tax=Streptosporangium sp. NPDC002544 TaxID=3154538 RepID=UPI0033170B0E
MSDSALARQVLIFTNRNDLHSDVIIGKLHELRQTVVRLNTDDIPQKTLIELRLDSSTWIGGIRLGNGRAVELSELKSTLVRRPEGYVFPQHLDPISRGFADAETRHTMGGLWESVDCYWMSRPDMIRAASWKPEQLQRAARMGFEVPRTLISTDPDAVREFHESCSGRIVFKSMTGPAALASAAKAGGSPQEVGFAVRVVTEEDLSRLEATRISPCLFQEYIPKSHEIRATVIGDEVFAAEIRSQDSPETSVDFRQARITIPYRRAVLPPSVETRCLEFVHSYGLTFGALDIVVTPDGRFVFLENNPVGQFMFVERKVPELRMTDALVACLARGAGAP